MLQTYKGKTTWLDLVNPSLDELDHVKQTWKIHSLIIEELKGPSARTKAEKYGDYIFMVLHFPNWNPITKTSEPYELDVVLGPEYIITASYQEETEMRRSLMERVCYKDFEDKYLNGEAVELFHFIIECFLDFTMRQISHIDDKISNISERIFKGEHKKMIQEISYVKRDILDFRRIYRLLEVILSSLARVGPRIFGVESSIYFDDLAGDSVKVGNTIENFADTIDSLEMTNNSLIEHKTNLLTRIYTILSFITWPTLLVVSSFQMNAKYNPLTGKYQDYFLMILVALIPSILLYFILKKKKII